MLRKDMSGSPSSLWQFCMAGAALTFTLSASTWYYMKLEQAAASVEQQQTRARLAGSKPALPSLSDNFVSGLPVAAEPEAVIQRMAEAVLAQGATLTDSRVVAIQAGSDSDLPRTDMLFGIRGSYQAVKAGVGEVLVRTPAATLQRLNVRRQIGESVDAELTLTLWLRPRASVTRPK